MQYLMLVCREPEGSPTQPTEADRAAAPDVEQWWNRVNEAGKYVTGNPLEPAANARSVRVRNGERLVTEGPFVETSEYVMGFDLLECDSMEEAVEIAAGHSMAYGGVIEVRAIWPM